MKYSLARSSSCTSLLITAIEIGTLNAVVAIEFHEQVAHAEDRRGDVAGGDAVNGFGLALAEGVVRVSNDGARASDLDEVAAVVPVVGGLALRSVGAGFEAADVIVIVFT